MKRILISLLALTLGLSAYAQVDIKSFNKIGPNACLNKLKSLGFDTSNLVWNRGGEEGHLYLEDKDGEFVETFLVIRYDTYELVSFQTNSSKISFLSDYVNGGLKVGDDLSKAMNTDFSASRYGRGNTKNNCTKVTEAGETLYVIFGENEQVVKFEVSGNKISWICFRTPGSEAPRTNYDYSNTMF
jgi:hypothetical protein